MNSRVYTSNLNVELGVPKYPGLGIGTVTAAQGSEYQIGGASDVLSQCIQPNTF